MLNFGLIWELTKRDFTERFAGSILGSLWAVIWPLVNLLIYIIIFGKLMGGHMPENSSVYGYGIYVTVGLVPWTAFSATISRSCSVFMDKKHIITKLSTSLPMLLVYVSLSETITFLITMGIFFAFLVATGYTFSVNLVLVPFIYYLMELFAVGFGLLMATLTVFIRDLQQVIGIILQFWFWFTPIVYVPQILPDFVKRMMVYNPAYVFVESFHQLFVYRADPPYRDLMILTILVHLMLMLAYAVFRTLEKDVRDFL
jgi:lipopolysaccharide transport system permease protein